MPSAGISDREVDCSGLRHGVFLSGTVHLNSHQLTSSQCYVRQCMGRHLITNTRSIRGRDKTSEIEILHWIASGHVGPVSVVGLGLHWSMTSLREAAVARLRWLDRETGPAPYASTG